MDALVGHVTDFAQAAAYGVMTTPALVVDGKVAFGGKVLKKDGQRPSFKRCGQESEPDGPCPAFSSVTGAPGADLVVNSMARVKCCAIGISGGMLRVSVEMEDTKGLTEDALLTRFISRRISKMPARAIAVSSMAVWRWETGYGGGIRYLIAAVRRAVIDASGFMAVPLTVV